jgi:hypothetical protein
MMKITLLPAAVLVVSLSAGAAPQMCFDQAGKITKLIHSC